MEKERRLSGSRIVHLVRRPSDRHPTGGLKLVKCINTFVFEVVENSSAESAGLLVGDLVMEVNGIPCTKLGLEDLEEIITAMVGVEGVSLRVKSDQRIVLNTKERGCARKNSQHLHPEPKKGVRGRRARRNLFPTTHSTHRSSSFGSMIYYDLDTPSEGTDVAKPETNGDRRTDCEPHAVDPISCKDAATNTEYVSSYFMSARLYRDWLESQKRTDVRMWGDFANRVRIYDCMSSKKDSKHAERRSKSKSKNKDAETPDLKKKEKKDQGSTPRKKALGAVLNSVGRLFNPRKGSIPVSEDAKHTPIFSKPRRSSNLPS